MSRILVIDDERSIRNTLKDILEYEKYSVELAEDGIKAFDKIKAASFDVVLCDIKMPGMDGYTAARKIKELNPAIPIIGQTAFALEHEVERFKDVFDSYLIKPIDKNKLRKMLGEFL